MARPQTTPQDRLERAKQLLVIAESGDAKREAYKAAAEQIAAYKAETGESIRKIAVGINRHPGTVSDLLKWRKSGYKAPTPYTMTQEATQESSTRSTAKRVIRERPQEVAAEIAKAMEQPEVRDAVVRQMRPKATEDLYHDVRGVREGRYVEPVERERRRHEAETFARNVTEPIVDAFARSNVLLHLEQALEDLQELGSCDSATYDRGILLLDAIRTEFEVKRAMEGVR